jgi:DNA-binding NarL/FixJ family response regulator
MQAVSMYRKEFPFEFIQETPDIKPLTPREYEVLSLIAQGYSEQKMADELVVSTRTVNSHIRHAYSKLGLEYGIYKRVVAGLMYDRLVSNNYQPVDLRSAGFPTQF